MKRRYDDFINEPLKAVKRKGTPLIGLQIQKQAKKEPMLRFVALFRGYLVRKWLRFKVFLFYR
jgi:hypothetical protein